MRCHCKRDVGMVWVRVKSTSKSHAKHPRIAAAMVRGNS
jgi:hypothetical protein